MQARRTHLRRPRRVHQDNLYSSPSGFVLDKLPELVERPGVVQAALGRTKALVRAFTDTLQVFQRDGLALPLGRLHDMLADSMVHPRLVATFLARKPFEDTPRILAGRLRARICLRLEGTAHLVPLPSVGIQRLATKRGVIGERSDVSDTQVNAECPGRFIRFGQRFFDLDVEVVSLAFLRQRSRGGIVSRQGFSLEVADLE